jgi:hypothetical protein
MTASAVDASAADAFAEGAAGGASGCDEVGLAPSHGESDSLSVGVICHFR